MLSLDYLTGANSDSIEEKPLSIDKKNPNEIIIPNFILNRRWYKRLKRMDQSFSKARGLLDDFTESVLESKLVISMMPYDDVHIYAVFDDYIDFFEYQKKFSVEQRYFHEVILGDRSQKGRFDIDITKDDLRDEETLDVLFRTIFDQLIDAIVKVFKEDFKITLSLERDILVFTSHGEEKRSCHVIIDNFFHLNNMEASNLYFRVIRFIPRVAKELSSNIMIRQSKSKLIDGGIYTGKQNFRIVGSQKRDSNRPKIFSSSWLYNDKWINHVFSEEVNDDNRELFILSASLITNITVFVHIPIIIEKDVKRIVNSIVLPESVIHSALDLVEKKYPQVFTLTSVSNNKINLKRLCSSHCDICCRIHDHEGSYLRVNTFNVYFYCYRNEWNNGKYLGSINSNIQGVNVDGIIQENNESENNNEEVFMFGDIIMRGSDKQENNSIEVIVETKELPPPLPSQNGVNECISLSLSSNPDYLQKKRKEIDPNFKLPYLGSLRENKEEIKINTCPSFYLGDLTKDTKETSSGSPIPYLGALTKGISIK
jgi:hypothetical protein